MLRNWLVVVAICCPTSYRRFDVSNLRNAEGLSEMKTGTETNNKPRVFYTPLVQTINSTSRLNATE